MPIPDTDDDGNDSDATIDYDPQNLNYTEYWAATRETLDLTGSATTSSDYALQPPDCVHDVKCDMVLDHDDGQAHAFNASIAFDRRADGKPDAHDQ